MRGYFRNNVLKLLEAEVIDRLQLRGENLPSGQRLEQTDEFLHRLYFLEGGAASVRTLSEDGFQIESYLVGSQGLVGGTSLLGYEKSSLEVSMLFEGYGYSCRVAPARAEFRRGGQFHEIVCMGMANQHVALAKRLSCVAHHTVIERLANWLLTCQAAIASEEFELSHAQIAALLGTRRATITAVLGNLEELQMLLNRRGRITLLNSKALEGISCGCNSKDSANKYSLGVTIALGDKT